MMCLTVAATYHNEMEQVRIEFDNCQKLHFHQLLQIDHLQLPQKINPVLCPFKEEVNDCAQAMEWSTPPDVSYQLHCLMGIKLQIKLVAPWP